MNNLSHSIRRFNRFELKYVIIPAFLVLGLGDQPIVAYTPAADGEQTEASATLDNDATDDSGGATGRLETLEAAPGAPEQSMIQGG